METQKLYQNICRICLNENVVLNWNNRLFECYGVTYKDCYYKYTNLENLDDDPLSCMLCENCISILQSIHTLVLKAIESYKYLMETKLQHTNATINEAVNEENELKYAPPNEFEMVMVQDKQNKKDKLEQKLSKDILNDDSLGLHTGKENENFTKNKLKTEKVDDYSDQIQDLESNDNMLDMEITKSKHKLRKTRKTKCKIKKNEVQEMEIKIKKTRLPKETNDKNTKKGKKRSSYVCSICSKVLNSLTATKLHEQTHTKDRKRNESCEICGLKFYNRGNLKEHMRTHNKDREKNHKCDFCNKAFYNRSSLNIHRRKHLGQTVTCTLCSKEFVRQIDLDLHMNNQHSANTLNGETKKRSRYMIRCKQCNKSMLSTSFRSHIAVHLNQPLMKCLLCEKEFFRRESCTFHLKNKHKKSIDVYNEFILIYEKKRLSHLFLEQTADIISDEEE